MVGTKRLSRTVAIVLLSWSPTSLASQGTWTLTATSGGPPGLFGLAGAYDLTRSQFVLHGGFDANFAPAGGTWEFDGRTWRAFAGPGPGARGAHTMAYDFARGRTVLFGGTPSAMLAMGLQDTWDFDGMSWQQRQPLHRPPGRFDHATAYDFNTGRVIVHGGRSFQSNLLGDTWGFDGNDWRQLAVTGPSPRYRHAMSYDLQRQRTVLFGGRDTSDLGDTWEWNGTSWSQPPAGGPCQRNGHRLVYDLSRSLTVLHGGNAGGDETWVWDGGTWTLAVVGSAPRQDQAMVFDARLQRSTLFGGVHGTTHADVQVYGQPIPGTFVVQGASCAGSTGTPSLTPPTALSPGPILGATSAVQVTAVTGVTFFVFGMSDTNEGSMPLPVDLGPMGMPGCALQCSRDAVTSAPAINGIATLAIAVPDDPFLIGLQFYLQAFPLDLVANALGFVTSNALVATVGRN